MRLQTVRERGWLRGYLSKLVMVKPGKHEKIKPVRDLEFAENGRQVIPQGLFTDAQLFRELFVRSTCFTCECIDDQALFSGKSGNFFGDGIFRLLACAQKVGENTSCGAPVEPQLARMDLLDGFEDVLGRFFFIDNTTGTIEYSPVDGGLVVNLGKDDNVGTLFLEQIRDKVYAFFPSEIKVE
jgi:hypothetical protein